MQANKRTKFGGYADYWFELAVDHERWSQGQQKKIKSIIEKKLKPRFGDMQIGDIVTADIANYRNDLLAGKSEGQTKPLSVATTESILVPLRRIFNQAQNEIGTPNPFTGLKPLKQPKPGSKLDPLTREEVERFLEHVDSRFYEYFVIRFFVGLTAGEADGLRWQNILINTYETKGTIRITHSASRGALKRAPLVARRKINISKLDPIVHQALLSLMARAKEDGTYDHNSYLFARSTGKPLDHTNTNKRVWHPTLEKAGVRKRAALQTRATACVFWIQSGKSLRWIASAMGYKDDRMLMSAYADYIKQ